jgi:hypothetical protein
MLRDADVTVLPGVDRFGLLDFEALDAIADAGVEAGAAAFAASGDLLMRV